MVKTKKSIFISLILFFLLFGIISVKAEDLVTTDPNVFIYPYSFDKQLAVVGTTISSPDKDCNLLIGANVLSSASDIILKKRLVIPELVGGKAAVSNYWEFDLINKKSYNGKKPLTIQLQYQEGRTPFYIAFWDGQKWQSLPSKIVDPAKRLMEAKTYLTYGRFLIIGGLKAVMVEGEASWYKYKNCNCAASPDYPKNSILRVTNLANNKSVDVKVNDYGPDRLIHLNRVIDLDLVAFKKIANYRLGLIDVKVQPVKVSY